MTQTYDVNVLSFETLISPDTLKNELPMTDASTATVVDSRATINRILNREDPRLLVVTGPCSIHDETAALEYAEKLKHLSQKVSDQIYLVMRVYFEKPRTTVGWKGLINDPNMDGSCDMVTGLRRARKLLLDITGMGLPAGTEMLDHITPQYVAGLVSWAAIGARTTESQTHREMASGLSMPVGFKNCTDGGLVNAFNAMVAARSPQSFLGIDPEGRASIIKTRGNPGVHVVLRGGERPNYDCVSIGEALAHLKARKLPEAIVVDCSHANSRKKFEGQAVVWKDVLHQRLGGNDALVGMMLESNLHEGSQSCAPDPEELAYGVSVTDECISWETTEELILFAHDQLKQKNG
jgi:3-deoxy-7-phosphoheptulonate synthase